MSEQSKHTPGPWAQRRPFGGSIFIEHPIEGTEASETIVLVSLTRTVTVENGDGSRTSREVPIERAQANADLIEAAPDLLCALKEVLASYENETKYGGQTYTDSLNIRAVIAKAEGRHG